MRQINGRENCRYNETVVQLNSLYKSLGNNNNRYNNNGRFVIIFGDRQQHEIGQHFSYFKKFPVNNITQDIELLHNGLTVA